jgi:hypothetical protein
MWSIPRASFHADYSEKTMKTCKGSGGIREAIIGFDNDAGVLFFYPEDVKRHDDDADDFELEVRSAESPAFHGEPNPVLALKRAASGLWFDSPYEWVDAGAQPNGWVAFTTEEADFLRLYAGAGDLLIPLVTPEKTDEH